MKSNNVVSIVLLALTPVMNLFLALPAFMLAMASTGCHDGCPLPVVEAGMWIALFGPWIVWMLAGTFTVIKLVKKENALTYSLITLGGAFGAFLLGVATAFVTMSF